jgi:hypothetical protein
MKSVMDARILLVTLVACLAVSTTRAGQPDDAPEYRNSRSGMSSSPSFRGGRGRPALQSASMVTEPESTPTPSPTPDEMLNPPDSDGTFEGPGDNTCSDCYSGGCQQRGLWYGSVDYLLMRPRLSEGFAEIRRIDVTNGNLAPNTTTRTDESIQYPFKYQSGFRAALGYRMIDCGGDIQVAYWRLTGNAQVNDGPAVTQTNPFIANPFIAGQLGNNPGNGQFFSANTAITANIFDVDFSKCLSLGGPQGACDACFCPRWDLRWSAGARIADISRYNNNVVSDANGNGVSFGNIDARFVGAGPRVGVQGRRYFGCTGLFSLYAKASQGLLIGDFRMSRTLIKPGNSDTATQIGNQFENSSRMVPVTDIEVGGTWQIAPYTFLSAGYFFQCWWDLGQAETIGPGPTGTLNSANILGFDGLFVRGEMLF